MLSERVGVLYFGDYRLTRRDVKQLPRRTPQELRGIALAGDSGWAIGLDDEGWLARARLRFSRDVDELCPEHHPAAIEGDTTRHAGIQGGVLVWRNRHILVRRWACYPLVFSSPPDDPEAAEAKERSMEMDDFEENIYHQDEAIRASGKLLDLPLALLG
jgi:hypothetical protein